MPDNITPIPRSAGLIEVGGPVDEFRVSVAIYGPDLDPDAITSELNVPPTSAHRRGERAGPKSPTYESGAWIRTSECIPPAPPDDAVIALLSSLPRDPSVWAALTQRFTVQLRIGIHTTGWNRGFSLNSKTLALIAATGLSASFDLYSYGDDDDV